jgi:hypothetical protein
MHSRWFISVRNGQSPFPKWLFSAELLDYKEKEMGMRVSMGFQSSGRQSVSELNATHSALLSILYNFYSNYVDPYIMGVENTGGEGAGGDGTGSLG